MANSVLVLDDQSKNLFDSFGLRIPSSLLQAIQPSASCWDLLVPANLPFGQLIEKCQKHFPVLFDPSLLEDRILVGQPIAAVDHVVQVNASVAPDLNFRGRPAKDLGTDELKFLRAGGRMLLELNYFLATGEHLDMDHVTLCPHCRTGNRVLGIAYRDGQRIKPGDRGLHIYAYPSELHHELIAPREILVRANA
jgi:hypothetical protein